MVTLPPQVTSSASVLRAYIWRWSSMTSIHMAIAIPPDVSVPP